MNLRIKRAYEPCASEEPERHLVDRLWPRGVKRKTLVPIRWLKEVAPSDAMRRWFGLDPARWNEFRLHYRAELQSHPELLAPLHPAVLEVLASVASAARAKSEPVSICGEMVGNPAYTTLLLGLGFRSFSVSPGEILEIKNAIRSTSLEQADHLARKILELGTIQEANELLHNAKAWRQ